MNRHTAICDWLQLDPAHYDHIEIVLMEPGLGVRNTAAYLFVFLDGSVSDWRFTFDEDGTVLDGYCYNDVI
jgi:hypothetical protein